MSSANKLFLRYLKPAAATKPFSQKKQALKFELAKGEMNVRGITRHGESPVAGEGEPEWELMFHARERNGEPFISGIYRMNLVQYSKCVLLMTFALCRALKCNPVDFMRRLGTAMVECVKQGGVYQVTEGVDDEG